MGAVTEYGYRGVDGIADIFSVSDALFSYEFEIKVNKGDLQGELRSIREIYYPTPEWDREEDPIPPRQYCMPKLSKHKNYLDHESFGVRPNRFFFAVTSDLLHLAVSELKNTPYGVIELNENFWECAVRKKSKALHDEEISTDVLHHMVKKSSLEIATLREKLLEQHG